MEELLSKVHIQINENIYLKNPESSELGRKIIKSSVDKIDELGFEDFTFRKLAMEINSPEASVYRYFESKHKLLLYLITWYWSWMEYRLVFNLANISSPEERLEKAITLLTEVVKEDGSFEHVNEVKLNRIVIAESPKTYLTRDVDVDNKAGIFMGYKQLVARVSNIILEINPSYIYPHMLVSNMIEGAHLQRYFVQHLPRLTDIVSNQDSIKEFYQDLIFKTIKESK